MKTIKNKSKGIFLYDFCNELCDDDREASRTEKLLKQRLVKGYFSGMTKIIDAEVYILDKYEFLNRIYRLVDTNAMKTKVFYRSEPQKKVNKPYGVLKQKS